MELVDVTYRIKHDIQHAFIFEANDDKKHVMFGFYEPKLSIYIKEGKNLIPVELARKLWDELSEQEFTSVTGLPKLHNF